jgi:hypothetical protein
MTTDVLDDHDVAAGDLRVEVLEQPDAGVAALVGAGGLARQLEEVEPVRGCGGARERSATKTKLAFKGATSSGSRPVVVAAQLAAELAHACLQLLPARGRPGRGAGRGLRRELEPVSLRQAFDVALVDRA